MEGAGGLGHLLAQQLVADGEPVLDVPPKLAARVRLLQAGDTNKNDPNYALSVAVAALRSKARREVAADDYAVVLKVWSKRHRDLSRARNQIACRLHAVLCDLVPGGFSKEITAGQASGVLESVTPAGAVTQGRHELASQFLDDLRNLDAQPRQTKKKLAAAVRASHTTLIQIFGVGPVIAGTVIGDAGAISLFASRDHFAAYNGTAPIEVSSGAGSPTGCRCAATGASTTPCIWPPSPRSATGTAAGAPTTPQDRRGQDTQGSTPVAQTADQQRHRRSPAGRRPPGRRDQRQGPGRATGERL